jgi:hypothetical protein
MGGIFWSAIGGVTCAALASFAIADRNATFTPWRNSSCIFKPLSAAKVTRAPPPHCDARQKNQTPIASSAALAS